jgi:hypothetical protein
MRDPRIVVSFVPSNQVKANGGPAEFLLASADNGRILPDLELRRFEAKRTVSG